MKPRTKVFHPITEKPKEVLTERSTHIFDGVLYLYEIEYSVPEGSTLERIDIQWGAVPYISPRVTPVFADDLPGEVIVISECLSTWVPPYSKNHGMRARVAYFFKTKWRAIRKAFAGGGRNVY